MKSLAKETQSKLSLPSERADISRRYLRFPREIPSEKRLQEFHIDDVSDVGSASDCLKQTFIANLNQKHYPNKGFDASPVWNLNFCEASFLGETSGSITKCRLFPQTKPNKRPHRKSMNVVTTQELVTFSYESMVERRESNVDINHKNKRLQTYLFSIRKNLVVCDT